MIFAAGPPSVSASYLLLQMIAFLHDIKDSDNGVAGMLSSPAILKAFLID
jgi:hypothetical protein